LISTHSRSTKYENADDRQVRLVGGVRQILDHLRIELRRGAVRDDDELADLRDVVCRRVRMDRLHHAFERRRFERNVLLIEAIEE
jgi:hypothetical protein